MLKRLPDAHIVMRIRSLSMSVPKPADQSLGADLGEAEAAKLNPFRTGDRLSDREREEKARRWREANADAIQRSNEELERHGLWCDEHRLF